MLIAIIPKLMHCCSLKLEDYCALTAFVCSVCRKIAKF